MPAHDSGLPASELSPWCPYTIRPRSRNSGDAGDIPDNGVLGGLHLGLTPTGLTRHRAGRIQDEQRVALDTAAEELDPHMPRGSHLSGSRPSLLQEVGHSSSVTQITCGSDKWPAFRPSISQVWDTRQQVRPPPAFGVGRCLDVVVGSTPPPAAPPATILIPRRPGTYDGTAEHPATTRQPS